jgi:hypothetical protein
MRRHQGTPVTPTLKVRFYSTRNDRPEVAPAVSRAIKGRRAVRPSAGSRAHQDREQSAGARDAWTATGRGASPHWRLPRPGAAFPPRKYDAPRWRRRIPCSQVVPRRRRDIWRHVASGPAADPAEHDQGDRCGDPHELAAKPAPPRRHYLGQPQPPRNWLGGWCRKSHAQRLALLGVLPPLFPLLGVRGEIGLDGFHPLRRQPAVDPRL